jgi:hypothetical protein
MDAVTVHLTAEDRRALAEVLLAAMEQVSEEEWRAGWYLGLERILWQRVTDGATEEGRRLGLLARLAGGWWRLGDAHDREFVPLAEWDAGWAAAHAAAGDDPMPPAHAQRMHVHVRSATVGGPLPDGGEGGDRWCDACGAGLPESPPVRVYEVRTAACEACPEVVVGAFCRACLGRLRDELTRALEQAA